MSRLLVELRDSGEYLRAAARELQRLIQCDDVVWMHADFPAGQFTVWRASTDSRDIRAEESLPRMLHHPAIESYLRDPANLAPRRASDIAGLEEPAHIEAFRLSQETVGQHQLSMVTYVDTMGLGRGWIMTRTRREFDSDHLDVASRLLPILVALDRMHVPDGVAWTQSLSADYHGWTDLSTRERQVVDLLATGLTAPAIGRILGISPRTVAKHLEHVYQKLGRHDRLLVAQSIPRRRLHEATEIGSRTVVPEVPRRPAVGAHRPG